MPGRIDIEGSRELKAAVLALRSAAKEVRANVRRYSRELMLPEFRRELAQRATDSRTQARVLVDASRITVSDQNVRMRSATGRRPLSGGLVPSAQGSAFEFGSNRRTDTTYWRTARKRSGGAGKRHKVTRDTQAQLPRFRKRGWAFYPTVADLIPRFASLWVQTSIRTTLDALERR